MSPQDLMQLAMSFVGALGFALFFNVSKPHILSASIGGLLTWIMYWLMHTLMGESAVFLPCLIAAAFAAAYAEVLARVSKVPTTVFFIVAIIPLVPGRTLFYTMSAAVSNDMSACLSNGATTLTFVIGISLGISLVTAIAQTYSFAKRKLKRIVAKREKERAQG